MIINIILVITTVLHCKSIVCIYNSTHRADHDIIVYLLHDTWLKSSDLSVLTENISQFPAFDLSAKVVKLVSPHMTKKGLREKVNSDDHNLTRYQMIHNAHCMLLGLASERLLQVVTCSKVLASRPGFCDEGAWLKKYLVVKRTLCHPSEL